jgi:hypothetical protein
VQPQKGFWNFGAQNDVSLKRRHSCEDVVFIREIYSVHVSLTEKYEAKKKKKKKKTNWNTSRENEFAIDM